MATEAQIQANRQNAQLSTGPKSENSKQRSSQNATKHGYTGLTLVITPAEKEAYEAHVKHYFAHHEPTGNHQTQLVQQLADLDWTLHKISVDQANQLSLISAMRAQLGTDDPFATNAAIAPAVRVLNTLSVYETRRRRAAKAVEADLKTAQELWSEQLTQAAALYNSHKAIGKPFDPSQFGFVCSLDEILQYIQTNEALAVVKPQPQLPKAPWGLNLTTEQLEEEIKKMDAQLAEFAKNSR